MNVVKAVLQSEVYPAIGCTEPVSCAYAAAIAAEHLPEPTKRLSLNVDMGTYKNGAAVTVPHSDGDKGNLIAAAMGAVLARSDARLQLLGEVTPDVLERTQELIRSDSCSYTCLNNTNGFHVEVIVSGEVHTVRCVLRGGHSDVALIELDGEVISQGKEGTTAGGAGYRDILRTMHLRDLLQAAADLDDEDRRTIRDGVEMNLAMSEYGYDVHRTAYQLRQMKDKGIMGDDLFYCVKSHVASAVDARMAGADHAVMTSGGSGNQGIVAILTPYLVGMDRGASDERIIESIAVAHVMNAYIKCYMGELSVICGCAMAAGIAASVAIVYQQVGVDMRKITFAVSNVLGDLSGLICDGAKPGCSMKTVTSVDAAMRAAFMAVGDFGLSDDDGVIGHSAEESIRNLGRIGLEGMLQVDPTVVDILTNKAAARGRA